MPITISELGSSAAMPGDAGPHSKAIVNTELKVDGKLVKWPLDSIELFQVPFDHHVLKMTFTLDVEVMAAPETLSLTRDFQNSIGKSVNLTIRPTDEYVDTGEILEWFGYITNLSLANEATVANRFILEAKSPTWLMDHVKNFKTYLDMNFVDVVQKIFGEHGQDIGEVSSFDSINRMYQAQWNQTDWEYITSTYKTGKAWIFYDGSKIFVKEAASRNMHKLVWMKNIGAAEIKMNVTDYSFLGTMWDEKNKEDVSSSSAPSTSFSALTSKAFKASKEKFPDKSALAFVIQGSAFSMTGLNDEVKKTVETKSLSQLQKLVTCYVQSNLPSVKIGDTIQFEGLGESFSGVYFVTEVTHRIGGGTDYFNYIAAVPLEIANPSWRVKERERIYDPVPAIVTDIDDPDGLGRIKVKFFCKSADDVESHWIRVASTNAGPDRGIQFMPEVDDEVLIAFEMGDPDKPVVIGALWNSVDRLADPDFLSGGKVIHRIIRSRTGHKFVFSDEDGKESISIIDKTGNNKMIIDSSQNSIAITADGDYSLEVKGNITLKATQDFSLEAMNVKITAKQGVSVEGMNVDVKAKGMMTLSANGNMDQSGAMINISGKGPVSVTGTPIKLN